MIRDSGRVRLNIADIRDTAALRHLLAGQDFLFDLAGADQPSRFDDRAGARPRGQLHGAAAAARSVPRGGAGDHDRACRHAPDLRPAATICRSTKRTRCARADVNGVNKMAGEAYHLMFHDVYGHRHPLAAADQCLRAGMRIKDARQNFLGIWLRRVLEGESFEVWGGEQRRELLYVDDAVEAFLRAALTPRDRGAGAQCRRRGAVQLLALAETLVRVNGGGRFDRREFPEERKRIDIGDFVTDDRRFRELTGWAPRVGLDEGLARSLDYYRRHLALYL